MKKSKKLSRGKEFLLINGEEITEYTKEELSDEILDLVFGQYVVEFRWINDTDLEVL